MKYDDLRFIIEKCINWKELSEVRGVEVNPEEYIMSLEAVTQLCENQIEPVAEEVDRIKGLRTVRIPSSDSGSVKTVASNNPCRAVCQPPTVSSAPFCREMIATSPTPRPLPYFA